MFLFTKVDFKLSAIFCSRACADVFPRCYCVEPLVELRVVLNR